jgi:hypothetical protein
MEGNLGQWHDYLDAFLLILAGLKILARYTKVKWDDKLLDVIDAPLRWLFRRWK